MPQHHGRKTSGVLSSELGRQVASLLDAHTRDMRREICDKLCGDLEKQREQLSYGIMHRLFSAISIHPDEEAIGKLFDYLLEEAPLYITGASLTELLADSGSRTQAERDAVARMVGKLAETNYLIILDCYDEYKLFMASGLSETAKDRLQKTIQQCSNAYLAERAAAKTAAEPAPPGNPRQSGTGKGPVPQ